jgi:hypothetical protein
MNPKLPIQWSSDYRNIDIGIEADRTLVPGPTLQCRASVSYLSRNISTRKAFHSAYVRPTFGWSNGLQFFATVSISRDVEE